MSESTVRFAVVGDIHFVRSENIERQTAERPESFGYDTRRYARMAETVLPRLVEEIADARPDFIVQLGDFEQGHRDPALARGDFQAGLNLLERAAPTLVVRGTHDYPHEAFDAVIPAHNAARAGVEVSAPFFSFERGNARFIVTDTHPHAAPEQSEWLEAELERSDRFAHVFVFGHEPAFNTARPFFFSPDHAGRMGERLHQAGVSAYFCGHTHNQCLAARRRGGSVLLQAKSCAIGDPAAEPAPLDAVRTWLLPRAETAWCWPGYVENSAPGWLLVETDGEAARLEWRRVGDGPHVRIEQRRGRPPRELFRSPPAPRRRLSVSELDRIRRAWLCLSIDRTDASRKRVILQGAPAAEFPSQVAYYHHRTELPADAARRLEVTNELRIEADDDARFCVSSVHLSAQLDTGEVVRSSVWPYIYSTTDEVARWRLPQVRYADRARDLPPIVVSF